MHGYLLKRALSPALPPEAQVNDGILYPLLAKLERAGLVRKDVERGGRRRRTFYPTARGRSAFLCWLRGLDSEDDPLAYDFFAAHPFLMKVTFFSHLSPKARAAKLTSQRRAVGLKLREFRRIREGMVERRVDAFRIAVLDLGIAQQRGKLRWLERMQRLKAPKRRAPTRRRS